MSSRGRTLRAATGRRKPPRPRPRDPVPCVCTPSLRRRCLPLAPGFVPSAPRIAPRAALRISAPFPRFFGRSPPRRSQRIVLRAPASAPALPAAAIRKCARWIQPPRATHALRLRPTPQTTSPAHPCARLQSPYANSKGSRQPALKLRADYCPRLGAGVRGAAASYLPAALRARPVHARARERVVDVARVWLQLQLGRAPGTGGSVNPAPGSSAAQHPPRDFPCGDSFPPSARPEFFPGAGATRSRYRGWRLPTAPKILRCGWRLVLLPPASCAPLALLAPAQIESPKMFRAPRRRLARMAGAVRPAAPSFSARRCAALPAIVPKADRPSDADYYRATIAAARSIGLAPRSFPIPGAAARRSPHCRGPRFLPSTVPLTALNARRRLIPVAAAHAPPGWWPPAHCRFRRAVFRPDERSHPTIPALARISRRILISGRPALHPASQPLARKIRRARRPASFRSRSSTS